MVWQTGSMGNQNGGCAPAEDPCGVKSKRELCGVGINFGMRADGRLGVSSLIEGGRRLALLT